MCETSMQFYPFKIKQMLRGCYKKGWCKNFERTEKLAFSGKTNKDPVLQTWDVEMHVMEMLCFSMI